jgi:GNAT acetyltransferase-like protein
MQTASAVEFRVREFRDADLPAVLDLLAAAYPAWPPPHAGVGAEEFFRWKHLSSPFGRSRMHLADDDGRILSFRASMPWHVSAADGVVEGMHGTDACAHPDARDRGVYAATLKTGRPIDRRTRALLLGTPNERTAQWARFGGTLLPRPRLAVRPLRPLRVARLARSRREPVDPQRLAPIAHAPCACDVLADPRLDGLLAERERPDGRLETARGAAFLRWRYGPPLDYRAVAEESGGELRGIAIFRIRPRGPLWEAGVTDLLVRPGDLRTARRLLARVAPADYAVARFPAGTTAAAALPRAGFVLGARGPVVMVLPFRPVRPDPNAEASWAFTLGDLEQLF